MSQICHWIGLLIVSNADFKTGYYVADSKISQPIRTMVWDVSHNVEWHLKKGSDWNLTFITFISSIYIEFFHSFSPIFLHLYCVVFCLFFFFASILTLMWRSPALGPRSDLLSLFFFLCVKDVLSGVFNVIVCPSVSLSLLAVLYFQPFLLHHFHYPMCGTMWRTTAIWDWSLEQLCNSNIDALLAIMKAALHHNTKQITWPLGKYPV